MSDDRAHVDQAGPCRVTLLTPRGRGAIASLSVTGDGAAHLAARLFRPARAAPSGSLPPGRLRFGRWRVAEELDEEVVVCRREDGSIDVNCHGGSAAADAIMASLAALGATRGDAGDWIDRQAGDPLAAAAHRELAQARTLRAAGVLLDQYRGALRQSLLELTQGIQDRQPAAVSRLQRLSQLARLGRHLTTPWRVVFLGPANTGKSSLMNAILGYSRCIVIDAPGTTRDVVTAQTALDGWPVELIDTAGLRDSRDRIESEGIQRARGQLDHADLLLLVLDARDPRAPGLPPGRRQLPGSLLLVHNKSDLVPAARGDVAEAVATSAVSGQGIDALIEKILARLITVEPRPGEAVPFTAAHEHAINQAVASMAAGDDDAALAHISQLL